MSCELERLQPTNLPCFSWLCADVCYQGKSLCHKQASCIVEMPAGTKFNCQCPPNSIGDGLASGTGCKGEKKTDKLFQNFAILLYSHPLSLHTAQTSVVALTLASKAVIYACQLFLLLRRHLRLLPFFSLSLSLWHLILPSCCFLLMMPHLKHNELFLNDN